MILIYKIVGLIFIFQCFLAQEEFTFGGASEEEDENTAPNITLVSVKNDSLIKSEMQFLNVICNVTNLKPNETSIRWLDKEGKVAAANRILYIKSLLKNDEGKYNCSVEKIKSPETKYFKTFHLNITIPSIIINILPDESLKIGGRVRRQCSDLRLLPETVVDEFTYTWLNQQNKTIGNSNILEIPIVDESVTGQYICQYKSQTTSKIYEAATLVNLQQSTSYDIKIIPTPLQFQYGQRFTLRCEVQPFYKDIKYSWYKNDEFLSSDQELMIKSFKKDNVGNYKCKAVVTLSSGRLDLEAESLQQFTLFRQSKIELSEKPGPQLFVHKGEKKELHCEIETNSENRGRDAIWFVNGKKLESKDIPNVHRLDRQYVSMLVINDISQNNEGNYECRVGSSSKEVNLIVLLDDGIIETSPPILKTPEGSSVEFHCRAENIPNVKNTNLSWTFESKDGSIKYTIPDSRWNLQNPDVAEQTSFIELGSAKFSDSGYYICIEPNGRTARSELVVIPREEKNALTITPKEIRVRAGQRVEIECFSKNTEGRASGKPEFHFENNTRIGRSSKFSVSNVGPAHIKLTAPRGLSLSDNNMEVYCSSEDKRAMSKIYVSDICPPGYRFCQNGQCLENAKFCDKVKDCADGSDENPISCRECDPISRKCEIHNQQIPNKNYFLVHWICDGEEDCGNGYDEINCNTAILNKCGGKYFTCSDNKTIPRGYVCDDNIDCINGEDETGCIAPQITKISSTNVVAVKSQEVTLKCEAKGKPYPVIIWRFNWGCIQDSPRFSANSTSSDCETVSSTLTIKDFSIGDDGIYTCEAISSRQRSFSDDFRVILKNN